MLRKILGVLGGAMAGRVVFALTTILGYSVFPLPRGLDMTDKAAVGAALREAPGGSLFMWLGWFVGVFVAVYFAQSVSRATPGERWPGIAVEAFLLATAVYTVLSLPFPGWMWLGLAVFPAATWLATRLARRRSEAG